MAITLDVLLLGSFAVEDAGATTVAVTTTQAAAAGSTIILCGYTGSFQPTTPISDNGPGLTWTVDVVGKNTTTSPYAWIISAYAPAGLASGRTITVTLTGSAGDRFMTATSFLGVKTSLRVDTTAAVIDQAGTAWTTRNMTTQAGSVLLAAVADSDNSHTSTPTAPALEIADINSPGNAAFTSAYRIEAAGGTYAVAGTWSGIAANGAVVGAAYLPASTAGFPTTSVVDNFTGANGSINARTASSGKLWAAPLYFGSSAAQITNNRIERIAGTVQTAGVITAKYGPDSEAYCTSPAHTDDTLLYLRLQQATITDSYAGGWVLDFDVNGYRVISSEAGGVTDVNVIHNGSGGRAAWTTGALGATDKAGYSLQESGGSTVVRVYRTLSGTWTEDRNATYAGAGRATTSGYIGFRLGSTGLSAGSILDDFGGGTIAGFTAPGAPTSLQAVAGDTQVSLSWAAPAADGGSGITSYKIYRGASPGGETLLVNPAGTGTTYTDSAVTNGSTYYYQVSAVNAIGESARSNEASATPAAAAQTRALKRLYGPGLLGTALFTAYVCPQGVQAVIRHIHVSNPSVSPVDFTLSIGASTAARDLWDGYPVPARDVIDHNQDHNLIAGEIVQAYASVANVLNLVIDGYELGAVSGPAPIFPSDTLFPSP